MEDHYIVCGLGRTGRGVVSEFLRIQIPFVVIDENESALEPIDGEQFPSVLGDATEESVLEQAGIYRARGIVAALPGDAANVFVTLTAREMRPNLMIVARAAEDASISKLRKAGANQVVSPYQLGGARMAYLLLHPAVVDFLDVVMHGSGEVNLRLEEVPIVESAALAGKNLHDSQVGLKSGAMILAVMDRDGRTHLNPGADRLMTAGEKLIALGDDEQLTMLRVLAAGSEVAGI